MGTKIQHRGLFQGLSLGLSALLLTAGCGAPTKTAGDVSGLFATDATTLATKASSLCDALAGREQTPTTKGQTFQPSGCGDAGTQAQDMKKATAFNFSGLDGDGQVTQGSGGTIHKSVRAQVWLNRSLLSIGGALGKKMASFGGGTGEIALPSSTSGGIGSLAKTKITLTEPPKMDMSTLKFGMKLHLSISGAIQAEHDIVIDGALINNAIAVTIGTTADQPLEKSLIKNFTAVIFIIPHAGDLYLDMFVDLNTNNVGLSAVFKQQLQTFLSTGLKGALDGVMTL